MMTCLWSDRLAKSSLGFGARVRRQHSRGSRTKVVAGLVLGVTKELWTGGGQ